MKYYKIENSDLNVSAIALGCMRFVKYSFENGQFSMSPLSEEKVEDIVLTALDEGINFFDHADIYGNGASEELFGKVLEKHPDLREKMIVQTKCGICDGYYDLSKKHIMESVEASLRRLKCGYLDILLLHRPDALMDVREVAEAFDELYASGKVRYFGVSNMNVGQIKLLKKYCKQPLLFNQLQFNIVNATMIDQGINVNMNNTGAIDRDGGILDYCQLEDITIQAWSILQASWEKGSFLDHEEFKDLNAKLEELAKKYDVSKAAISAAWILKHPAQIQAIAGTTNVEHLKDIVKAVNVELTKKEWYELYLSVNRMLP